VLFFRPGHAYIIKRCFDEVSVLLKAAGACEPLILLLTDRDHSFFTPKVKNKKTNRHLEKREEKNEQTLLKEQKQIKE
tara:strand:+ start:26 stop:259 length:234 start_codon:yes stop_codon:yes gene_type:complete